MRGLISWNGERSDQYGVEVESYPNYTKPERKIDRYTVPGRNGDIIMPQDAWENVKREYKVIIGDGTPHSVSALVSSVADWLCSPAGYCELWDDFDPGHFRIAMFSGDFDLSALSLGQYGRTTLTFDCKPQRFLVAGRAPVLIDSAPGTIVNPTAYASKPLIFVERSSSGNGTVTVNGTVFTITGIPTAGLYIDCDEMNCYDTNGNNKNSIVASSTSEFAKLKPGSNAIGFTGKVSQITITPRWFEL